MALLFADGFDHYSSGQILSKWTNGQTPGFGGPGRIGYGNYLQMGGSNYLQKAWGSTQTTVIIGFAYYINNSSMGNGNIFSFWDASGNTLSSIGTTTSAQLTAPGGAASATGLINLNAWAYIECQVTFSNASTGSCVLRFNGQQVASVSSVNTASNSNPCAMVGPQVNNIPGGQAYYDDIYVLNTSAPNNAFFGDVKVLPLYPTGNGRISGFSRFGGTSSGNYTAVSEVPPDGDSSYVYTATPGATDAYTITTLSNVTTIKAVQLDAYARKDDTPSRVLALGVGNGTTENFNAGTSLNTSYNYILRQLDQNPLTSANWAVSDFTTLQLAQQLIS